MKAEPKSTFPVISLVIVILAVVFGVALLLGGFTFKSITANTHTYRAFNQTWTATPVQDWGTVATGCPLGGSHKGVAQYVTKEENTTSLLHFWATTPDSFGQKCAFDTGLEVTLESVDLRNYSAGRIRRGLSMSFDGGNKVRYAASVSDVLVDTNTKSIDSFSASYGDITWTNDGNTITLKSDEFPTGKLISIGSTPVRIRMTDTVSTSPTNSGRGSIDLFITGVELVPMPASVTKAPTTIPVPVSTQPVVTSPAVNSSGTVTVPSTQVPIPVDGQAPSWWVGFLTIVHGAWVQFLGWFGVNA